MTLKQTLEVYELLDSAEVSGAGVRGFLLQRGAAEAEVEVSGVEGCRGRTDFVRVTIPGLRGRRARQTAASPTAPTLGIIGRLGGLGVRPDAVGLVSDADGAVAALAAAAKLLDMRRAGDRLEGDVIVATHVCPNAPTEPHDPVRFMSSPVDMKTMNTHEVSPEMNAILSIDATKGNHIINWRGVAVSPTVKEGWILRVAEDLLNILAVTTGEPPRVLPITTQDITPYGNGVYHVNSILQPATATDAPVVGVAVTAVTAVPGCATGASRETDITLAARFAVEVAKEFTAGRVSFYDPEEFERLVRLYGPMTHMQTSGKQ